MPRKWIEYPQAEYYAWYRMIRRCDEPDFPGYARYGGRGIRVCERWHDDFMAFLADMGLRPSPDHSLDRRDNDGDYTPENCRWATRSVQMRNREIIQRAGGATQAGDRWRASIHINGRRIVLGLFETKDEASRVYRQAAIQALIMTEIFTGALGPLAGNDKCTNCGQAGTAIPTLGISPPPPATR